MAVSIQVLKVRALVGDHSREIWFPWRHVPVAVTNNAEIRWEVSDIYPDAPDLLAARNMTIGFFKRFEILMPDGRLVIRACTPMATTNGRIQ